VPTKIASPAAAGAVVLLGGRQGALEQRLGLGMPSLGAYRNGQIAQKKIRILVGLLSIS
jgi:hypothetical protein